MEVRKCLTNSTKLAAQVPVNAVRNSRCKREVTMTTTQTEDQPAESSAPGRWELVRDIAVFQVKLIVDGLRDLILVPVSLVVGIISLVAGGDKPGREFYELLRMGRRSDRLINLFGAADRAAGQDDSDVKLPAIDDVVAKVESFVVEEYRKGGITAQAKDRIDGVIDSLHRAGKKDGPDRDAGPGGSAG